MSVRPTRLLVVIGLVVPSMLGLTACNSDTQLSSTSTCKDFMNAPSDEQDRVVTSLAQKYNKPDLATPLGRPEVPYECSGNPNETLGQLFSREND